MKYKIFLSMGLAGMAFTILTGLQGLTWLYQGTIRAGGPGHETVMLMIYIYFMVSIAGMSFATMFYIMDNEVRNWRPWQKLEWVGWHLCGTHFDRRKDPNTLKIYRDPFIYDLVFDGVNFRINRQIQDGVELLHHRFDKRIHPKELKTQLIQAIDSDFYGTPPFQTPKVEGYSKTESGRFAGKPPEFGAPYGVGMNTPDSTGSKPKCSLHLKYPLKVRERTFPVGTPVRFAEVDPNHLNEGSTWSKVHVEGLAEPIIIPRSQVEGTVKP